MKPSFVGVLILGILLGVGTLAIDVVMAARTKFLKNLNNVIFAYVGAAREEDDVRW